MWKLNEEGGIEWVSQSQDDSDYLDHRSDNVILPKKPPQETEQEKINRMWEAIKEFGGG